MESLKEVIAMAVSLLCGGSGIAFWVCAARLFVVGRKMQRYVREKYPEVWRDFTLAVREARTGPFATRFFLGLPQSWIELDDEEFRAFQRRSREALGRVLISFTIFIVSLCLLSVLPTVPIGK